MSNAPNELLSKPMTLAPDGIAFVHNIEGLAPRPSDVATMLVPKQPQRRQKTHSGRNYYHAVLLVSGLAIVLAALRNANSVTLPESFSATIVRALQPSLVDTAVQVDAKQPVTPTHFVDNDVVTIVAREKPLLVIHVGPPKTATTTIQETLSLPQWAAALARDNYTYTGAFYKSGHHRPFQDPLPVHLKLLNRECQKAMKSTRENLASSSTATALRSVLADLPCVQELQTELEPYRRDMQSLIVSDETIQISFDFESVYTLLQPEWDVVVVIGYRRFVHWLPSAKQQVERWTPEKPRMNRWASKGGMTIEGLFPNYWRRSDYPYMYTHAILAAVVPTGIPVRIMNMHDNGNGITIRSIRTIYLCDAIPHAKHACAQSRQLDATVDSFNQTMSNPSQSQAYDRLAMAAEAAGMIMRKPTCRKPMPRRHKVVVEAQRYHNETLHQTELDFPLSCPNQSEYQAFLQKSLDFEQQIVPEFYASQPAGAELHQNDYWAAVARNKYCVVDPATILAQPEWIAFFERMTAC